MRIKTKLTLLIAGGMMVFAMLFLIAGTVFSIHEVLLVKRYDLKIVARQINNLMNDYSEDHIASLRQDIIKGLIFAEKEENISLTLYNKDGNPLLKFGNDVSDPFISKRYPPQKGKFRESITWISWNHWKIDFYYSGSNCYVYLTLLQQMEIHEDITLFFFGGLPIIVLLSFLGGRIITSKIIKRAERIEKAASQIAKGNLDYRIPASNTQDEIQIVENNLNISFSELEHSFHQIMEFSSDIAHELRTPLTVILGELEVALRETRSVEEYQTTMAHVVEEISLLRRIIEDMLILVKPETAYKAVNLESIDISKIIIDTITSYQIISDSKNIIIEHKIEPGININGIDSLMSLIFSNLIYNAIKFTPEGGEIKIKNTKIYGSVEFSVSDTGPGIPLDEHTKIFSRFYRSKSDLNNKGIGLGLAIVKKVCDIHNAIVSVESFPEKGSIFKVIFKNE